MALDKRKKRQLPGVFNDARQHRVVKGIDDDVNMLSSNLHTAQSDLTSVTDRVSTVESSGGAGMKAGWPDIQGSAAFNTAYIYAHHFIAPIACEINRIIVISASSSSHNIKYAIYDDSSSSPGDKLVDGSAIRAVAAAGQYFQHVLDLSSPLSLTAGSMYWFAWQLDSTRAYYYALGGNAGSKYKTNTYADGLPDSFGAPTGVAATVTFMVF